MGVAQRIHRDPGGEIEVALAARRGEPGALAALECEVDAREDRKQVRRHGSHPGRLVGFTRNAEMKCAASPGGTR